MKRHREYPRLRPLFAWTAVLLLVGAAGTPPSLAQPHWTNTIQFPDEPYRVIGSSAANPDWIKFTIKVSEPETVYYQDSNLYTFHYDFVTAELDDYVGISLEDFNEIALYEDGQELILGAVLMPASGIYPEPLPIQEYGIQFVRMDPYEPEEIVTLFNLVKDTVIAAPEVEAFYFPTYEQWETAQDNLEYFADQGITVSTASRWADGNACYSEGWALGELKYFDGDDIEEAYLTGALLPEDIVLTDGVPATMPFVAGILTLTPSTPNSHVAILANNFGIPFVHLAVQEDAALALSLVGHRIVLRAYDQGYQGCDVQMIDVEGVLTEEQITQILALKIPPPLDISPVQTYGEFSENTNILDLSDVPYFGGKAANYGFLRRAIPDNSPVATAFSFDLWTDFLDQMLANGNTLREEIELTLSGYTWPPNMEDLADDLDYVRDLIRDKEDDLPTTFSPEAQIAVFLTIFDPQYGFDPYLNIRFRSSTNVEDTAQFTGAGLYDSYSGCVLDDLDGDDDGPSWCDPEEEEERGVFRALRKVFASFYNDHAYIERLRHGVNENDVGMAILVHHSFPDEFELANGVATFTLGDDAYIPTTVQLVTQLGAVSVTNPEPGVIPEVVTVRMRAGYAPYARLSQYSSLVPLGQTLLDFEAEYIELSELLADVAAAYVAATGADDLQLDFEYKKVAPGGAALPSGGLVIKQVRRLPPPDDTKTITPFLINEPVDYVTLQGDYGTAFANHRLKGLWHLETRNTWLTLENLQTGIFADAAFEYTDGCSVRSVASPLADLPAAWHAYDNVENITRDGWSFDWLANPRHYELIVRNVSRLVAPSESAWLTLRDLGDFYLDVNVEYDEPVPTISGALSDWTTTDAIRIGPVFPPTPHDRLQQRIMVDPTQPYLVDTTFYWPTPEGLVIWATSPLGSWVETRIEGLTSEPIILHNWYAQTYRPHRHNFSEDFLFEPRLEPGLSPTILAELDALDVHLIHVVRSLVPGGPFITLHTDADCLAFPCALSPDCGFPDFDRYCAKLLGDCDAEGICTPRPLSCPPEWPLVCGCDGITYPSTCHAAQAGVSTAAFGPCHDGDLNGDGSVDADDLASLAPCLTGPAVPAAPECDLADQDHDGDVDLADLYRYQWLFRAPG